MRGRVRWAFLVQRLVFLASVFFVRLYPFLGDGRALPVNHKHAILPLLFFWK
jgi:hypothetical protein